LEVGKKLLATNKINLEVSKKLLATNRILESVDSKMNNFTVAI
jgi:hypothetical protein